MPQGTRTVLSDEKAQRLRQLGLETKDLSESQKAQVATLDDEEINVLAAIKTKLNRGAHLDPTTGIWADGGTIGGFVW